MLPFSRELSETRVRLIGPNDAETIQAGANLLVSLIDNKQFKEADAFARKHIPLALAKFGPNHQITFHYRDMLCHSLMMPENCSTEALDGAITMLEETVALSRRTHGPNHPHASQTEQSLIWARAKRRGKPGVVHEP